MLINVGLSEKKMFLAQLSSVIQLTILLHDEGDYSQHEAHLIFNTYI